MSSEHAGARLVLPLSSSAQDPPVPRVFPGRRTRLVARPTRGALDIGMLCISGVGTPGGAADWIVNDIEVDGRSQLEHKDLPGVIFGTRGVASVRGRTTLSLSGLDTVERDRELAVIVTYVGPNPEGVPFFGTVIGSRPQQRPTVVPIALSSPVARATKTTIRVRVQNVPFRLQRLEIANDDCHDWTVDDLRVNGRSQLRHPGPLPGSLFAAEAIDTFLSTEICEVGNAVELDVTYNGQCSRSSFNGRLKGVVAFPGDASPPPDLQVLVEVDGQGPADVVVASCDWRPPALDDSAP